MIAFFDRFIAIPGLVITSAICYTLLSLHQKNYRASESQTEWARENRVIVTIIVQLLSQLFGLIHVHVVCALLRSSLLVWISTKAFPLRSIHFIQNVSSPRITWVLPWRLTFVLASLVLVSIAPAPLWAAAIAPLPVLQEIATNVEIPTFKTSNVSAMWEGDGEQLPDGYWLSDQGLFSYVGTRIRGKLLSSAMEASRLVDGAHRQPKFDNTGYIYEERSYGAGAVAGFEKIANVRFPLAYRYEEKAIKANVSCFRNESILYVFENVTPADGIIGLYEAHGELADGSEGPKTVYTAKVNFDLFAWNTVWNPLNRKVQLQFFVGWPDDPNNNYGFARLKHLQCDIGLSEEVFDVRINTTSKVITATPSGRDMLPWPKYGDTVSLLIRDLYVQLARSNNCDNGCEIGRALTANINRLARDLRNTDDATWMKATQDYFISITDDLLVNFKLTRLVSNALDSTEEVEAFVTVESLVFGNRTFIIIVCILNAVIVVIYIAEALRTLFWRAIPPLDIMNDSAIIMAAFEGGRQYAVRIMEEAGTAVEQSISEKTMLKLQYNRAEPDKAVLIPQTVNGRVEMLPVQQPLLVGTASRSLENATLSDDRHTKLS